MPAGTKSKGEKREEKRMASFVLQYQNLRVDFDIAIQT